MENDEPDYAERAADLTEEARRQAARDEIERGTAEEPDEAHEVRVDDPDVAL